jgi:hypothetical protein
MWDKLEADPELAGPWHQLFKQVQSPRHVISELLQNADDANATEATIEISDSYFIFSHNGEDFTEEHFASLCRFGYSNKRMLHTIGFRGIGFKSAFSLGHPVELYSPTLSVAFDRSRFTEPRWIPRLHIPPELTQIRVPILNTHIRTELEKNIREWTNSSVSMLFFKHIRKLKIGGQEISWKRVGPGVASGSEWILLSDQAENKYLVAHSPAEDFPDEAMDEIRHERMLGMENETKFPPCRIDIVLGAPGRLYVVLPTGVETGLPFACNAPFIQDPARLKIKDPETSPTNRWLLQRAGKLAADIMLRWLETKTESVQNRSSAYGLYPNENYNTSSLEDICENAVRDAFDRELGTRPFLLTTDGKLESAAQCVVIPEGLSDIWALEKTGQLLDKLRRPSFSTYVPAKDREKLILRKAIGQINDNEILTALQTEEIPKPKSWSRLLKLWTYVAQAKRNIFLTGDCAVKNLRILPAQGKDQLYAATQLVRLGEKKLLHSETDWNFIAEHMLVLNQNWPKYLADELCKAKQQDDRVLWRDVDSAFLLLKESGLEEASDVSQVLQKVAEGFFAGKTPVLADSVRLAQIAAKLGASAGPEFQFFTHDACPRTTGEVILIDKLGSLYGFFNDQWSAAHFLHGDYAKEFISCTPDEWERWLSSGRSGLFKFAPVQQVNLGISFYDGIQKELLKRGGSINSEEPYSKAVIADWNFAEEHWTHWESLVESDPKIWNRILEAVFNQATSFWAKACTSSAELIPYDGRRKRAFLQSLTPTWILKFRELPCLPDTKGFLYKPRELLLRTHETEALLDIEPFVNGLLDNETMRPLLLALGVRDKATGPDHLLACLHALAMADNPPLQEVDKIYRRLDLMLQSASTETANKIAEAFRLGKLILTGDGDWVVSSAVFLSADENDVPGAALIRPSVEDLSLWRRLGVAERPTAELAIKWLKELPAGQALSPEDIRRVRAFLVRHPDRIWQECGSWLNLAGEWCPTTDFSYAITMQSLTPWTHLHKWVKQKTADFQRLPVSFLSERPFSELPTLASVIEERFHGNPGILNHGARRNTWLNTLGEYLCRIELEDCAEMNRIRLLAGKLETISFQTAVGLKTVPYIDGTPVGTPRETDVVWLGEILYMDELPSAKLARKIPEEIGKVFGNQAIKAALDYSFERATDKIRAYMEGNFKFTPLADKPAEDAEESDNIQEHTPAVGAPPESPSTTEAEQDLSSEKPASSPEIPIEVENPESNVPDEKPKKLELVPKHFKPSLIEQFARLKGFRKEAEDRFSHPEGGHMVRSEGARFPWEWRNAAGETIRYYWLKEHCLEQEPLQIDADMWAMVEKFLDLYAIILLNMEGQPVEMTGTTLRKMCDIGKITLYPATYRIVYEHKTN